MVTGFPPYDMPAREDERFAIICNGELMAQLHAWNGVCAYVYHVTIASPDSSQPFFLYGSFHFRRGWPSLAMDVITKSRGSTYSQTDHVT